MDLIAYDNMKCARTILLDEISQNCDTNKYDYNSYNYIYISSLFSIYSNVNNLYISNIIKLITGLILYKTILIQV